MGTTSDKLIQIANNSTKLYDAGKNSVLKQFPESLQGSAIGATCALADISSIEHTMEVKLSSKNLIPYPHKYTQYSPFTSNGITFTDNGDGTITANGTATGESYYVIGDMYTPAGTYYFSCTPKTDNPTTAMPYTYFKGSVWRGDTGDGVRVELSVGEMSSVAICIPTGATVNNAIFKPQLEQGSVATEYMPYDMDFSEVKLIKSELNIWDEQWELGSIGGTGANQTATDTIRSKNYIPVKGGVKYGIFAPQMSKVVCYDANKKYYTLSYPSGNGSFTPSQDGYVRFAIGGSVGTSPAITEYENNICISVYSGHTVGIYESYIATEYKAEADGTVKGVTSIYPVTTLTTDAEVIINCNYIKDIGAPMARLIERSATHIDIPEGTAKIGDYSFTNYTTLTNVTIPNTVTSIGVSAFNSCGITSIKIPKSVTTIGNTAFNWCNKCKVFDFSEYTSIPTIGTTIFSNVFRDANTDAIIIVPFDLYSTWAYTNGWKDYSSYMVTKGKTTVNTDTTIDMVWTPGTGSWMSENYNDNPDASITPYYKKDGVEITNNSTYFSNIRYESANDGTYLDYHFTSDGWEEPIQFHQVGLYEFGTVNEDGKVTYRAYVEVTE